MVFVSNMIFDFDLFNLMRKVDGKQLMMGRSVALPKLFRGYPPRGSLPVLSVHSFASNGQFALLESA